MIKFPHSLLFTVGRIVVSFDMDFEVLSSFQLLFKAFAFEPLENENIFKNVWIYCHGIVFITQFFTVFIFRNKILYIQDRIGKACDLIKFFTRFASYGSGIFVSWYLKSRFEKFTIEKKNLDILLDKFYVDTRTISLKFHKRVKRKFLFLLFQIYLVIQEMIIRSEERQSFRYTISFAFPCLFCTFKLLHEMFYIDMRNEYFEVLNEQLKQIKILIDINENKLKNEKYNQFLFKRLKLCRNLYRILIRMKNSENKTFGLFHFFNQINLHNHILCNLYWLTFRFVNNYKEPLKSRLIFNLVICLLRNFVSDMNAATVIVTDISDLFIISNSAEKSENLIKLTASLLQTIEISRKFKNCCISELARKMSIYEFIKKNLFFKIESFSYEILADDVEVSACRFFNINLNFFKTVRNYIPQIHHPNFIQFYRKFCVFLKKFK